MLYTEQALVVRGAFETAVSSQRRRRFRGGVSGKVLHCVYRVLYDQKSRVREWMDVHARPLLAHALDLLLKLMPLTHSSLTSVLVGTI